MNATNADAATCCPHCGSRFRITRKQLQAAHGSVRCGTCKRIFDASAALIEDTVPGSGKPRLAMVTAQVGDLPMELPEKARLSTRMLLTLAALSLAAILILFLQLSLWDWARLRTHPDAGPWLERLCNSMKCPAPSANALELLISEGLMVRTHPQYEGALAIDLQLHNRADFSQPWPDLQFVFSDLDGNSIAGRRFRAPEYFPEQPPAPLIGPRTMARIHLDIRDPGPEASGYVVQFLPGTD